MSFHLLNLPIEPIDGRYSVQWDRWFKDAFFRAGIDNVTTVYGNAAVPTDPENGQFLDPIGTHAYKFSQLQKAVTCLQKNSHNVVFLHDGWFPGIECFAYIARMSGYRISLCAFWHAGSYDPTDLLGRTGIFNLIGQSESSWMNLCRRIFVGTEFHKNKITSTFDLDDLEKIIVTGCPVNVGYSSLGKKEPLVVWPHRLSPDKQPNIFEKLSQETRFSGVQFVRTKDLNLSKSDYYSLLDRAKVVVSTALHENFGISMVEAATRGCIPVVPYGLSYDETLMDDGWFYSDYDGLVYQVEQALAINDYDVGRHVREYHYETVTNHICREIIKIGGSQ